MKKLAVFGGILAGVALAMLRMESKWQPLTEEDILNEKQ
jgi:hypothetical protein